MKLQSLVTAAVCGACLVGLARAQYPASFGYGQHPSAARPAPAQTQRPAAPRHDARVASLPNAPAVRVAQAAQPAPVPMPQPAAAPYAPGPAYRPVPDASISGGYSGYDSGYMPATPLFGGDYDGPAYGGMTLPIRHCFWCKGTGDMAQHYPYCAEGKGYYYFRPYHVMHVFAQQEMVTRWGGDPRNPYENSIFQRVHEQMEQQLQYQQPIHMPGHEYVVPQGAYPSY